MVSNGGERMIDVTKYDLGGRLRTKEPELDYATMVDLANEGLAFVYQRLSKQEQVKKHIWSVEGQNALEDLARQDGYPDALIYVEKRDLGISGTLGREDREGLAYLIELVEAGKVEAVYVVHISRLWRDQTLINGFALGELFKEHGVIIVTPQMRLNLRDKMHMRIYRMEVERAADELELMSIRMLGARNLKARSGRYAGETIPPGYVVDTRKTLGDGHLNPNYQGYLEHKPHLDVVRVILNRLAIPGETYTTVARYCDRHGIVFSPFPPELDTKVNRKTFSRSKRDPGGNFPVTVFRVRSIAHNPAYIGLKVWGGEVVGKDVYPPAVEKHLFWTIQERFDKGNGSRPKKDKDPLPLAGLLYCGRHDTPRGMSYHNREPADQSLYQCFDHDLFRSCTLITCSILDGPIGEAIASQLEGMSELAEEVLNGLTDEYQQAKEEAASYRREMRRLEEEVDNLRGNLASGILGADTVSWIDQQVTERLARIRELADLESRPIGRAVGRPIPGKDDIELVRATLENLGKRWPRYPNGLKNAFLRLLLDRVVIWSEPKTVKVRLVWRIGLEQELLVRRRHTGKHRSWDDTDVGILQEHFEKTAKGELMEMLPGRTWRAILNKGHKLGLSRAHHTGSRQGETRPKYTPEEDELIRRYYAGEINLDAVRSATGRTLDGIQSRAKSLGLGQRGVTWVYLSEKELSPRTKMLLEDEKALTADTLLAIARVLRVYFTVPRSGTQVYAVPSPDLAQAGAVV